ncbi:MAG: hypothetical protein GY764_05970 [Halieaceae bacterium]|nr:hypothetical protein [Halieaceae bacterium]
MTVPRCQIVDPQITPWYHCISECVRQTFLLNSPRDARRRWIEQRLRELNEIFAIDVGSYAILNNHLHVLVHLDVKTVKRWSRQEVLRRWAQLHSPRNAQRRPIKDLKKWIKEQLRNRLLVNTLRKRLADLGWFMKSLKEPFSRMVNKQDGCRGTLWASRYKSIAILDEEALLATCAYVDLNPLAAGLCKLPEAAQFTSLYTRIDYCRQQGKLSQLQAAREGAVLAARQARGMEAGLWLCPLDDQRRKGAQRAGILEGFSLGSYLLLVDATSRLFRPGKARIGPRAVSLLDRIGITVEMWQSTLQQMFAHPFPSGVAFSFYRSRLRDAAAARGVHHLVNLNGCPT